MDVRELKERYQYAMHGGGAYHGLRQTNTREAVDYWYKKGVCIFELDMALTDDGQYVAVAHDLRDKSLRRLELFNAPESRTAEWFLSQKLFSISTSGLTPLSLADIVDMLRVRMDMAVMLDLFSLFTEEESKRFTVALSALIGDDDTLWDRILIEAYNASMAEGIHNGYSRANVIYCVRYEENLDALETISPEELRTQGISFVSYPWYCTAMHPGELEAYVSAKITVCSRTKFNTKDKKLKAAGVSINLIAKRFDGAWAIIQWLLYMVTYGKRLAVKIYIRLFK